MKILQLAHKPPYPGIDGGCIAMQKVTESFLRLGNSVDLFVLDTYKHPFIKDSFPEQDQLEVHSMPINLIKSPLDAVRNLFSDESYIMARFNDSEVQKALKKRIRLGFDVIWVESIFWLPYIDLLMGSGSKLYLRSHNIEHAIWRELAFSSAFPKAAYLRLLSRRLRREELIMWQAADKIFSISSIDSEAIRKCTNTDVVDYPMSVAAHRAPVKAPVKSQCFHLGAMDWIPNQEGMRWFLEEVWPKINRENSSARFHLAGRRMTTEFKNWKSDGVIVYSEIENGDQFRAEHGIMVVPLFSGSGLRIKILEALAQGIPIIATSKGVEGMPEIEKSGIVIADHSAQWIDLLNSLLHRPDEGLKRAKQGRKYVLDHFSETSLDQLLSTEL